MHWVLVLIGVGGPDGIALATAQFETRALCQAAAEQIRDSIKVNDQPGVAGVCVPATEDAT
jgi:hypothetical protein